MIVALAIGTPLTVICLRISQQVVNDGVRAILYAIAAFIFMLGMSVVLHAIATYRQAQFAKPSHNIDNRRQSFDIDARRQVAVVDANGQPVQLPAGHQIVEVMR
ncbi:MAG: hypothetical protein KKC37_16995 [Proteobacteria bacterium]|nr:hypothetical protein [Pseudomonadota bacterium]